MAKQRDIFIWDIIFPRHDPVCYFTSRCSTEKGALCKAIMGHKKTIVYNNKTYSSKLERKILIKLLTDKNDVIIERRANVTEKIKEQQKRKDAIVEKTVQKQHSFLSMLD